MRTLSRRQKGVTLDIWPGFVDALATLLMVMIFALMIFVVSQVYLSDALQGSQRGLESLQAKLQEISNLLLVEKKKNTDLTQSFQVTTQQLDQANQKATDTEVVLATLQQQVEELNQKLQALTLSLQEVEAVKTQQKLTIEDLDKKLTAALAQKVEELEKYRSEFFGKLKELLENRSDVRIVGDRFVFQSEVLFPSGQAIIGKKGEEKLKQLATTLKDISAKMPADLKWVLRVDGHTDTVPIHNEKFQSNWELSAARAISVINFLMKEGISGDHLTAAGFGEFHPIEKKGEDGRNRRIEFKLDQR